MTFRTLIRRSLRFHWRAHLGVVLGAAIGSTALIGALVVGDSVKQSLLERALHRLGEIGYAMETGDRFVTDELANGMKQPTRSGSGPGGWDSGWDISPSTFAGFGLPQPLQALLLGAVATRVDGAARANHIQLIGAPSGTGIKDGRNSDDWFFPYFGFGIDSRISSGSVWVNRALAEKLNLRIGDEVIFRLTKASAVSGEVAVSARNDQLTSLRLRVERILSPSTLGDFDLRSGGQVSLNAFANRQELQRATALDGKVNLLLQTPLYASGRKVHHAVEKLRNTQKIPTWMRNSPMLDSLVANREAPASVALSKLAEMLQANWRLADLEVELRAVRPYQNLDLVSRRIFLDAPVVRTALTVAPNPQPILTYLVNLLSAGTNTTPYSMVTAAGAPWTPADMRDDEIIISQWLADDLRVKPGDEMSLVYFDPESGARLVEHTNSFRVRAIVPMEMPWADRTLMPDFPGIEKAKSTSDWDAGFPLVHKIRDKDEEYWKKHRGTPKAFVTLAAGQKMWANRFGSLTAIRFPIPGAPASLPASLTTDRTNTPAGMPALPVAVESYRAALEKTILANLKPEELGLRFEPVREQALKAAEQSQDFGGLFLGFSFFLIIAALLLMAMLFQFGLEQRTAEIGTLLALGFTPKQVRRLLLGEGVALAFIGGVLGALGGLAYARAMLHGLATIWRDAVGASALSFHATPQTLIIGLFAATVVGAITIWLALRRFVRIPARALLVGDLECGDLSPLPAGDLSPSAGMACGSWLSRLALVLRRAAGRGAAWTTSRPSGESGVKPPQSKRLALAALVSAAALVGWAVVTKDTANAMVFFGAGALVLVAGLSFVSAWLARRTGVAPVSDSSPSEGDRRDACPTLSSLALNGCARRRTRSLATVAMLACGSFLIVSIGVFRLDANRDASKRTSGTGGFALIGETTMPVLHDVNAESGRDFFALSERDLDGVNFVPFRVRQGDEASCLNLNRAQKPRLLGVTPKMLEGRFSFASMIKGPPPDLKWNLLKSPPDNWKFDGDVPLVPAIGDANSVRWAMGKGLGETIDFQDEQGRPFKVWIVATVANSILQGQLLIDEAEFVKRFPGESGYRMFLIDAPSNRVAEVSATLSRAMQDVGLELTPTAQRLAQFNAVQNTYLGTFQVLGGLGLLLGSVGLGIVVLRNVLERRGELAVLLAVGFRRPTLQRLLLIENGALLALGLALGVVAAAVAVLPALLSPSAQLPVVSLTLTLVVVLINGALWTWAATRFALRGDLLAALRNE
jgi:ABC-type antimicrobial peptide transport system permease subunit